MSDREPRRDRVFVESIEFYGYHGASDDEMAVGHRYCVDVEVEYDTRAAARSDHLADTISYSRVARRIVEVGTTERVRLIETLAQRMADTVLREFPVRAVRLRVRKVRPPTDVIAAAAGVEIERCREDVAI